MEKKKEWKPEDLKGKTVYDFCDDEEILKKIIPDFDDPVGSREYIEGFNPVIQLDLIHKYAKIVNDESLRNAIARIYLDVVRDYEDYVAKLEKEEEGLIVD